MNWAMWSMWKVCRVTVMLLVPRRHVKPEFGVVVVNPNDDATTGYNYREEPAMNAWLIELGKTEI